MADKTWTCQSCGWVNDRAHRRGRYSKQQTCSECRTRRCEIRNVAEIEEAGQYELLDRNRSNCGKRRHGMPHKRKDLGGSPVKNQPTVMTHPDGTAWG